MTTSIGGTTTYGRIYLVTNKLNGKQYVGQTVTKHSRHGHGHAIKDAYKKYGHSMFLYEPLTQGNLNQMQLDCFEKFWVDVLDCLAPKGKFDNLESVTNEVKLMMDPNADPFAAPANPDAVPAKFGASDVQDLNWVQLLNAYTCTECGRCTSACPANITGKKLKVLTIK